MKLLPIPDFDVQEVYALCVESVPSVDLKRRLKNISPDVTNHAQNYATNAQHANFYQLPAFIGKNADIVLGAVTKEELKKVYTDYMVGQTMPARRVYDALKSSVPLDICPYCGFGQVGTLDRSASISSCKPNFSLYPYLGS